MIKLIKRLLMQRFSANVVLLCTLLLPPPALAEHTVSGKGSPVLTVASEIDFPPYAIVDATGRASGFSVELLEAVAEAMALSVKVTTGPWPEVLAAFKAGKTDLLPLVALSAKRADMATYTKPHTVAYDCFFVRRGSKAISSLADAKDREVIVMSNDAAHDELLASGVQVHIVESNTIPEAMRLLAAGKHDAVLVPKLLGHLVLHESKLEGVIEAGQPIADYNRQFAFAVQRGNTDLRDRLDQGIAIIRATGKYDAIYKKWFGGIDAADRFDWRIIMWGAGGLILLVLLASGWVLSYRRQIALKKSEQVQSELLEKLNQAQQLAMVGSWEWNLSTNKVWWSDETYRIFGVTQQDFVPDFEANGKFIHPDDLANYGSSFEHSFQTGELLDVNVRLIVGDGEPKHCHAKGKIIYDISGKPIRFVGTIMDITERKRKEDDLNKMKNILSESEGIAHMGTFEYVTDTNATLWSEGEYRIYGLNPEGPAPTYDVMLVKSFHPDDAALLHQTFTAAIQSGSVYELEHRIVRPDGGVRWVYDRANPYFDQNGTLVRYVGSTLDITERKQILQELRDKNTELDRFAYTVSHDLKSPLITIQAYAGMIKNDLETGRYERAQDDMKRIEGAADKMTSLLNDLLELSRAGRMMNVPSPVDMNHLVEHTLQQLTGPIAGSHVEIVLHPDLPSVLGDEKRIAEVVQNLIENAIKYMGDQAAPCIEIGTRQEGRECVFFVSDNGKGIDPRHHEKVFGLFNKLDGDSEGTGVGLALVKRIVEVHGGRVWVESEGEGTGSRFCFTVPG